MPRNTHSPGIVRLQGKSWGGRHLSFYRLNVLYFSFSPLVFSGVFYALNEQGNHIGFMDSLFMCASATTSSGLETVLNATLSLGQQILLWVLMLLSSMTTLSLVTLLVRIYYFKRLPGFNTYEQSCITNTGGKKTYAHDDSENQKWKPATGSTNQLPIHSDSSISEDELDSTYAEKTSLTTSSRHFPIPAQSHSLFDSDISTSTKEAKRPIRSSNLSVASHAPEISWRSPATPSMSSENVDMNEYQQTMLTELELEYRALLLLLKVVLVYLAIVPALAAFLLAIYLRYSSQGNAAFEAAMVTNGANITIPWFAIYQTTSGFTSDGMSPVDASMVPFNACGPFLFLLAFVVAAGNSCYPIFLRLILWTMAKTFPSNSATQETLRFLLDHPRRCFLYLFRSYQTWFLLAVLLCFDLLDMIAFVVLDLENSGLVNLSLVARLGLGWFQAIMSHSGGFAIIGLSSLAPAVQFLYMVNFILGVYPLAITIRASNSYRELSNDQTTPMNRRHSWSELAVKTRKHIGEMAVHFRWQLSVDMAWVAVVLFLLLAIEDPAAMDPTITWITPFSLSFEVCSAYAGVGLSLGLPTSSVSLSGSFSTVGKILIILTSIRGCLRGLPLGPDRAVQMPANGDDLKAILDVEHSLDYNMPSTNEKIILLTPRRRRGATAVHEDTGPAYSG